MNNVEWLTNRYTPIKVKAVGQHSLLRLAQRMVGVIHLRLTFTHTAPLGVSPKHFWVPTWSLRAR